ncbi:hypothetical protein [Streptomyces avicenniae]|uniref:hypothetical protein n=1 Tax=Streptomyces avicenniae TaxID=500153 RepID=UPI0006996EA2|nr:hypothetical protein [Streptomyces avicenniae]
MDTRPLRAVLAANVAVFLLVCVVFLVHQLGVGLYPDAMESWLEDNQWLMWTAAVVTLSNAPLIPLLSQLPQRPEDER